MDINDLKSYFESIFNTSSANPYFSPGRINLIGEHTDYNGGFVLPCAITFGTFGLIRKRQDKKIRLYSLNFKEVGLIQLDLLHLEYNKNHSWANYVKGMIKYMSYKNLNINLGFDILVYGNIPNGAGLSSSASLEMLIGTMLKEEFSLNVDKKTVALTGKRVENEYIGVNSGIMDQFAVAFGKKNSAIMLDCNTLYYEYVDMDLKDNIIVIMNTNKRRELADSKYNERKSQCEKALLKLQSVIKINNLCDLTLEEFNKYKYVIKNPIEEKRALHAISENERTKKATELLKGNDLKSFGVLMNQSHLSLRDNYEVTGKELDILAESSWNQRGCLGARMTGAGFGGCAIAIVSKKDLDDFVENVSNHYKKVIGYDASFYVASIGEGSTKIN
ncbi:galactokinase [Clostridium algidicarnis]|uniref:galactokinase n=1 Tax=Clostridium algidicarnis TaxID=37659 RepID=UPI001C0E157C|nr:galactokinase [Clostridium algidicarnis]MBU3194911.1 galactokinase [Clostridium algidicarnis]MCB2287499.1 galactokinase [Clostridium algidicarnis]